MKTVFYGDMACRIGRAMPEQKFPSIAFLDSTFNADRLAAVLPDTDVLVSMAYDQRFAPIRALKLLQLPGVGLDQVAFASLPAGTAVAVCRGHEQAVAEYVLACDARRIGGAIIDVWNHYPGTACDAPAPSRWPFETLPNVLLTPHISAWTEQVVKRRAQAIAHNLAAVENGTPLADAVSMDGREVGP